MPSAAQPIQINGSFGEGGGALLRTSLAMAALTLQPIRVINIRGAMRRKGLHPEDILFLRGLQEMTSAKIQGDQLESTELVFEPQSLLKGIDIKLSAAELKQGRVPANSLVVAQGLIPLLARSGGYSHLHLGGETHNRNTITFDAFEKATAFVYRQLGLYCFPTIARSGFGYGTIGDVEIEVEPSLITGIDWQSRGKLIEGGMTVTSTDYAPHKIQDVLSESARVIERLGWKANLVHHELRGSEPGLAIALWAHFENGCFCVSDSLAKGESPQEMVTRAESTLTQWLATDATVDPFLADQLLLPVCLSDQPSTFVTPIVTRRLTTMANLIKQFLPITLSIKGREGQAGIVSVKK